MDGARPSSLPHSSFPCYSLRRSYTTRPEFQRTQLHCEHFRPCSLYINTKPRCFLRPPRIWFYPNFAVLFGVALLPFLWWTTSFLLFTSLWQEIYQWSPVISGIHL